MRITQGTFSYLPDLTDDEITAQIGYAQARGWAVAVEFTDDPHPRNSFWEMHGLPMFDLRDAAGVMAEIDACRKTYPNHYVKVNAFDATHGWEALRLSFIVNRPKVEPGFALERQEANSRSIRYTTRSYAARKPEGERYA